MFSAMHRRLSLWLAGLFVVAQIFGVVSLMNSHAVHLAEAELLLSDHGAHAKHDGHGHHYRGDADGAGQVAAQPRTERRASSDIGRDNCEINSVHEVHDSTELGARRESERTTIAAVRLSVRASIC